MMHTRVTDLARVLLRAADIAEKELIERGRDARLGTDGYSPEEGAAYKLLRWLSDGANEIVQEDEDATRRTRDQMDGR